MRFFYLITACILLYFARGHQPLALAAWFYMVFLLRFFRKSRPLVGYLIAVSVLVVPVYFASFGMVLLPHAQLLLYSLVVSVLSLIPFLLDRLFYKKVPKKISYLLFPSLMVSLYFLYSFTNSGTWGNPAYAFTEDTLFLQLVSLTGIWGFIFISCLFAAVFNHFWEKRFQFKEVRNPILVFLILCFLIYSYGVIRLRCFSEPKGAVQTAALTPAMHQRSDIKRILLLLRSGSKIEGVQIEILQKIMVGLFENLLERSDKMAAAGASLVVWSEGAVVLFESDKENLISKACELARNQQIYLGFGLIIVKKSALNSEKNGNPGFKNSFIFINSEGQVAFEYQKAKLVAGLEAPFYNPGEGVFHSYDIPEGRISAAICYEMDFPDYIRKAGKMGTEILLAPSSDWMGVKNIHSRMAVMRAVENGFSLLRPTSDGITLAVDPFGRIVGQIDYFISKKAFLITELPVKKVNTLYTAIGDWLAWLCLIFSIILMLYMLFIRKREKMGIQDEL